MRRNLLVLAVLLFAASFAWLSDRPKPHMEWQDAEVHLFEEAPYARVYRNGNLLFESKGEGRNYHCYSVDLGGSKQPELVLLGDYGGTYPTCDVAILDGDNGEVVYQVESACYPQVKDFNGDGILQFGMRDNKTGNHKQYPLVLFRIGDQGLEFSREQMRTLPTPSKEELRALASGRGCARGPTDDDWFLLTELCYRGRSDLAHFFLHQIPGAKAKFHQETLWHELQQSEFWVDIDKINQRDIVLESCSCQDETVGASD